MPNNKYRVSIGDTTGNLIIFADNYSFCIKPSGMSYENPGKLKTMRLFEIFKYLTE